MVAFDSSWSLSPATQDDLTELATLAGLASVSDTHTQLKALAKGYGSEHDDVVRYHSDCIQSLYDNALQNARYDVTVARDESGVICGSIVWARSLSHLNPLQQPKSIQVEGFVPPATVGHNVDDLENVTNQAMKHYMNAIAPPGTACRYVVSINVLPKYQGRGIGTALIKWGVDRAEREGLFCWVSSGNDSIGMFERMGFKEVSRLELDLDQWALNLLDQGKEGERKAWGVYTWSWLVWRPTSDRF